MSERRFFVSPDSFAGGEVFLSDDLHRHIGKVLRLAVGDEIVLLDGTGSHFRCRLEHLTAADGRARVLEQWVEEETTLDIRLIQAMPKGEKYDLVLQKGTELGISRFSPVWSERSVPKLDGSRLEKRVLRWQRIVAEAARQCRRPVLPHCDQPAALEAVLADCRSELKLMLWEEESRPLKERLPSTAPADVAILVGPEGGFSRQEADIAQASGFLPVSLGPRILRSETAGFAVTAVLEYLYGDFGADHQS